MLWKACASGYYLANRRFSLGDDYLHSKLHFWGCWADDSEKPKNHYILHGNWCDSVAEEPDAKYCFHWHERKHQCPDDLPSVVSFLETEEVCGAGATHVDFSHDAIAYPHDLDGFPNVGDGSESDDDPEWKAFADPDDDGAVGFGTTGKMATMIMAIPLL